MHFKMIQFVTLLKREVAEAGELDWLRVVKVTTLLSAKERLCGCRPGSLYPRLITYHAPSSSLVSHRPSLCPPPVLSCGKFLETRPSSKFPAWNTSWWVCEAKPHIPAPLSLSTGPSSIPCLPSPCSSAPSTTPLSQRLLSPRVRPQDQASPSQVQTSHSQSFFKKAAQKLPALSASSSRPGCHILHPSPA